MAGNTRQTWIIIGASVVLTAILALHSLHYMPYLSDDALISLRYSHRLLHGHGLTWTEGRPVEGYSNLLWVLLVAGAGWLGTNLISAVRILGVVGMGAVLVSMLTHYCRAYPARQIWFPLAVGLLFYVLAAPVAVWAIGGMEQPLYAALLAAAVPLAFGVTESQSPGFRRAMLLSLALGLICLTRPDGPVFTCAVVLSIILGRRSLGLPRSWHAFLLTVSLPLIFYGGQMLFRIIYYGETVPNTALVKIAPSAHHLASGLKYVGGATLALAPFSFLAIFLLGALLASRASRSRAIVLLMIAGLWLAYVIFIGGDIFPAYRHFIQVIVVFAYALVEGLRLALPRLGSLPSPARWLLRAVLIVLLVPYFFIGASDRKNRIALEERWEWDGEVVGLLLKAAFAQQQPLVAVTAAGCVPYWSELPCLDMLGLNDYYLPRHPPGKTGRGLIGHELGETRYVLDRKPDIIVFHTGTKGTGIKTLRELQRSEEFLNLYTPVLVRGYVPHEYAATLWVRRYSDRIGIRQGPEEIRIPGLLLNADPNTVAYLDAEGHPVVPVSTRDQPTVALSLADPEAWDIAVEASRPNGVVIQRAQGPGKIKITLSTSAPNVIEVREVLLRRTRHGVSP